MSEVTVIGAGILGLSIAFQLAHRGAKVTVIDAGLPGQEASSISFAWLNAYNKKPFHYHNINRRSIEMWPSFIEQLCDFQESALLHISQGGEVRWAVTQAGADKLKAQAKQNQEWGYPTRMISETELQALEPGLNFGQCFAASYSDIDGHVDTALVVEALVRALEKHNAQFYFNSPVTAFDIQKDQLDSIWMDDVKIESDLTVLACGADSPQMASLLGIHVPLRSTFGATSITESLPPIFQSIAVLDSPRDGNAIVNVRQFPDGRVMLQGYDPANTKSEFEGDRGRTDAEITRILQDAQLIIPGLQNAKIMTIRRGRRPIPEDDLPIIGLSEKVKNVYIAACHSGVTLTPFLSEMIAIEILENTKVDLLGPYRLRRFI